MSLRAVALGGSCLALLAIAFGVSCAVPPLVAWTRFAVCEDPSYPNAWAELRDVVVDASDDVYAVGEVGWDMGPEAPWHGATMVVKWDEAGDLLWSHIYAFPDIYNHPKGATVGSNGHIFITGERWPEGASGYNRFITEIDADGNHVFTWTSTSTSYAFHTVAEDADGQLLLTGSAGWDKAYVARFDFDARSFVWAGSQSNSPATALHAQNDRRVPGALSAGGDLFFYGRNRKLANYADHRLYGAALEGGSIWVIDNGVSDRLVKINRTTGEVVASLAAPSSDPRDLAWDGSLVWCAEYSSGVLYGVDPATGAVVDSFATGLTFMGGLDYDGTQFWALANDRVYTIDPATRTPIYKYNVGGNGGICVAGGYVWVSYPSIYERRVYRFDPVTGSALGAYRLPGTSPQGIELDAEGYLWNSDSQTKLLYECSLDTGSGSASVVSRSNPLGITNVEDSILVCLSSSTGALLASKTFDYARQEQPMAMAVDSDDCVVSAIWHREESSFTVAKHARSGSTLAEVWAKDYSLPYPYVFPRDVTVDARGLIYVVGRASEKVFWDENTENAHMFTLCCDGDGVVLWQDVYDPGGGLEQERGRAYGVAVSSSGRTSVGGTLSSSSTGWKQGFVVIAYEKTIVDTAAVFRVDSLGTIFTDSSYYGAGFFAETADIAERVRVTGSVEAGDVLELDPSLGQSYRLSQTPCSSLIAGVVSTQPGITLGAKTGAPQQALLALSGIVPVKVTDEGGPIQPGDLLVSSSTPGYAMRWAGPEPCPCALVGKALEPMSEERGVISVLLTAH